MGRLVEFDVADGGTVLVEVAEVTEVAEGALAPAPGQGPVTRGLDAGAVASRARRTFEEAVDQVLPAVHGVIAQLRSLADDPDEVTVEFGLDLHAECGAFVAAASAGANFSVALTWRRGDGEGAHGQRPGD